ncbi:MAG: type II secretion system protein GspM [Bryobacteraceae bacterium]
MKIERRDKRALAALAVAGVALLLYLVVSGEGGQPRIVGAAGSIPAAEGRLARVRQLAAGVSGRERVLQQVSSALAEREKGVIQADTAAQAQAQLVDVVKRVARSQTPPLEFGTVELSQQVVRLGEDYGEVQLSVPFTCRIDELLNFLADLTRQPEALATTELRVSAQDARQKTIAARLTIAGVVPKRLVPQKKALF